MLEFGFDLTPPAFGVLALLENVGEGWAKRVISVSPARESGECWHKYLHIVVCYLKCRAQNELLEFEATKEP